MCHSTNWDRLRNHLISVARDYDDFSAGKLSELQYDQFVDLFSSAFGQVTDLVRRYEMFISVTHALATEDAAGPTAYHRLDRGRLGGPGGLYEWIEHIDPFNTDPQQKKLRVLLQQLQRTQLLIVADPENLLPAIEYHLIRLYLRTGRVSHVSPSTLVDASDRSRDVRSVNALRSAVEQAMFYTAEAAELSLPDVNEIEWQIARSFCERSRPRCEGPPRPDKPVHPAVNVISAGACPFVHECDVAGKRTLSVLKEPTLAAHHRFY